MSGGENSRICRRCLLADMEDERPFYELVKERLALLAREERAQDALYAERLSFCRECQRLVNGTCAACGCYVELRAAKINMICPQVPPKW